MSKNTNMYSISEILDKLKEGDTEVEQYFNKHGRLPDTPTLTKTINEDFKREQRNKLITILNVSVYLHEIVGTEYYKQGDLYGIRVVTKYGTLNTVLRSENTILSEFATLKKELSSKRY